MQQKKLTSEERRLEIRPDRREKVETLLRRDLGCSAAVVRTAKRWPDGILLDGKHVCTNEFVQPGQTLSILLSDRENGDLESTPGRVEIVYQDSDLMVINKAAGVPVHPSPGHHADTLGNFLTEQFRQQQIPFRFRPVHRLDRGTTGLMVVARHAYAQEKLKDQLHTGRFRRVYLAVCRGRPPEEQGTVDQPICREEGSPLRRRVSPEGAPAVTHYRVLHFNGEYSLVQMELETGRTHQIRVHMAWLGCPLAGDFLYGEQENLSHTLLHSWKLYLTHPITGEVMAWEAPVSEEMTRLIGQQQLNNQSSL